MKRLWWVFAFALLAGCATIPTGPTECNTTTVDRYKICGWAPMDPLPDYAQEFAAARECIEVANANGIYGQPRPEVRFRDVTWMSADSIIRDDGVRPGAITETALPVRITMVRRWMNDGYVVHHEALHAWLGPEPSHPRGFPGEGSFGWCDALRYENYWQ